ncbi:MAG: type I DNA topoisomerase [Patescibacteria group bacterium]|jgi:DNA topoisomerase-1
MGTKLVIVESPTKAKTIAKFLGKGFKVLSSFGHIRDLPKKEIGVDTENGFKPRYVIPTKSRKTVNELKKAASTADEVFFASDEDREGEAIAWHLQETLKVDPKKTRRISFHEITEEALTKAMAEPREIDMKMVDAQQARRILDRLVGYELSPFLWKKVARGLSAGRVQSVVVRLLVEREREILAFKPQEYWSIEALLGKKDAAAEDGFTAKLLRRDGETIDKMALTDAAGAQQIVDAVTGAAWKIASVERKTTFRSPPPPYTTSTLQQDANTKLGFSAKQTMMLAQQLYEGVELGAEGPTGLITYMRTDSVNLADKFIEEARSFIGRTLGADLVPETPRKYKAKSKLAQEAHEAIRPTDAGRRPEDLDGKLDDRQLKLYELIWRRAVASQMTDAELAIVAVDIDVAGPAVYTFRSNGTTVTKKSFMMLYDSEVKEARLPELTEGETLVPREITPKQHFTEPPPFYSEAALVKTLEENGIGRPSTYAPTISTVIDRGYVQKDGKRLRPTELALLVNDLLVKHFPDIVDYKFTAKMEDNLDEIAEGGKDWAPIIADFYGPFKANLKVKETEISKKDVAEQTTDEKCEKCGKPMIIKYGRFGRFLACTGFPACRNSKPLPGTEPGSTEKRTIDEKCPNCGLEMVFRRGRFGEFISCSNYPTCKTTKTILKKIGVTCPGCGQGDMVEKKTRTGKTFYACSRYPECKHAMWSRPTGEACPKCKALLVFAKADVIRCSNKECDFEKKAEK